MAKSRIPVKWQLLLFGWVMAILLAAYTLPSYWEYINLTQAEYAWLKMIGITAAEAMILWWVWWHVFRRWWATRLWCLAAATIMGIVCIVHASAVGKYNSAKKEGLGMIQTLGEYQAKIAEGASKGAVAGASEGAVRLKRAGGTTSEVRAVIRQGGDQATKVGAAGQQTLADAALKLEDQAKNSTFLSPEYMNGKMFAVIFAVLLVLSGLTFVCFELGKAEEDDDGDNIPNFADSDSAYYDARRASKWWGERGQRAPHELAPPPAAQPAFGMGFGSGAPRPTSEPTPVKPADDPERKKSIFRRMFDQNPNS